MMKIHTWVDAFAFAKALAVTTWSTKSYPIPRSSNAGSGGILIRRCILRCFVRPSETGERSRFAGWSYLWSAWTPFDEMTLPHHQIC